MKKFFSSLVLIFMLVPFAFIASACDADGYDKKANLEKYNSTVEVATSAMDNFTQTTTIELSDELLALLQASGEQISEIPSVTFRYDNGNMYAYIEDSMEFFVVDGTVLSREYDLEYEQWEEFVSTNSPIVNAVTNNLQTIDFDVLQEIAFKFNNEAITTKTENGVEIVSVKLDFGAFLEKVINNLVENQNKPIIKVIDQLIADVYSSDVTVESIVIAMKENITDETTINDVLDMVKESTGYDLKAYLDSTISSMKGVMSYVASFSTSVSSNLNADIRFGEYEFDTQMNEITSKIEAVLETPVFTLLETNATEFNTKLDELVATLKSENNTLHNMMVGILSESEEMEGSSLIEIEQSVDSVFSVLDMLKIKDFSVVIDLKTENETFKGYDVNLNMDVSMLGNQIVKGAALIKSDITNVGSTEVVLPSNVTVSSAEYVIEIKDVDFGTIDNSDLVIDDVEFEYLESFTIVDSIVSGIVLVSYNETTNQLTLNKVVIENFLEEVNDENASNLILIETEIGQVEIELKIVLIESIAE